MQHTTAATVVAVAAMAAGAGIAIASMITGSDIIVLAFILAFLFAMLGVIAAIGIVERGRDGYTGRPQTQPLRSVPAAEEA